MSHYASRYSVQSLNGQTNTWNEIYAPTSLKEAKKDATAWETAVKARRAAGKVHHSNGVRIVRPGDQGDAFFLRIWGGS